MSDAREFEGRTLRAASSCQQSAAVPDHALRGGFALLVPVGCGGPLVGIPDGTALQRSVVTQQDALSLSSHDTVPRKYPAQALSAACQYGGHIAVVVAGTVVRLLDEARSNARRRTPRITTSRGPCAPNRRHPVRIDADDDRRDGHQGDLQQAPRPYPVDSQQPDVDRDNGDSDGVLAMTPPVAPARRRVHRDEVTRRAISSRLSLRSRRVRHAATTFTNEEQT